MVGLTNWASTILRVPLLFTVLAVLLHLLVLLLLDHVLENTTKQKPREMPAHFLTLAGMGTFILWFGWFAFNLLHHRCRF